MKLEIFLFSILVVRNPFHANFICLCPFANKFSYFRCAYIFLMSTSINRLVWHLITILWSFSLYKMPRFSLFFCCSHLYIEHFSNWTLNTWIRMHRDLSLCQRINYPSYSHSFFLLEECTKTACAVCTCTYVKAHNSHERFIVILFNEKCLVRDVNLVESVLLMLSHEDGRDREHKKKNFVSSKCMRTKTERSESNKWKKQQLGGI